MAVKQQVLNTQIASAWLKIPWTHCNPFLKHFVFHMISWLSLEEITISRFCVLACSMQHSQL